MTTGVGVFSVQRIRAQSAARTTTMVPPNRKITWTVLPAEYIGLRRHANHPPRMVSTRKIDMAIERLQNARGLQGILGRWRPGLKTILSLVQDDSQLCSVFQTRETSRFRHAP